MAYDPKKKPNPRPTEPGGRPIVLDHVKFSLICEQIALNGGKYKACELVGFNYGTVAGAMEALSKSGDDSWREAWDEAFQIFNESLENEARRRARDGVVKRWATHQTGDKKGELMLDNFGNPIPVEVEYSDRLMEVLLKGNNPEKYRTNITMAGTLALEPVDAFANLTIGAKREIRAIIMRDLEEQREQARKDAEAIPAEFSEVGALEDMRAGDKEDGDE